MLALASALMLCGCSGHTHPTKADPVRVRTLVAEPITVTGTQNYSGTVEATTGTALSFATAGTIQQMYVNVGQQVARGQLIARLDGTTQRNAYDIAQATLNQAQDAYNRMEQLHNANALPDMQWVQAQNTLRQAQSAVAIAQKGLDDACLYAPSAGYIAEKSADVGMNILPGIPVVKLVDINSVKVNISVPENNIGAVAVGQDATVRVSALGDRSFVGAVTEKGVSANPLTRAYDVKIAVPNRDAALLPGMICDVNLEGQSSVSALVLPINSVLLDFENRHFVWVQRDGCAAKQLVTVRGMDAEGIVVDPAGIAGDSIIVEGQQKVSSGMRVVSIN